MNDGDFIDLLVRLTGVHIKARHVLQRQLPLELPDSGDALYFYAAITFFAGFSERWAQSTLKNAIPLSEQTAPGVEPQLPPARSGQKPA